GRVDRVSESLAQHRFVFVSPPGRVLWQTAQPEAYGILNESHVHSAAAVEPALGIAVVKIMNDSRHGDALELVQLVFEYRRRRSVPVEHQKLSDVAARIREPVLERFRARHEKQPRRLGSVGAQHYGLRFLKLLAAIGVVIN